MKRFIELLREILFPKNQLSRITREQAIQIAQLEAHRRGWLWREPVTVISKAYHWKIISNANMRGVNVWIRVHKQTGEILEAFFVKR